MTDRQTDRETNNITKRSIFGGDKLMLYLTIFV